VSESCYSAFIDINNADIITRAVNWTLESRAWLMYSNQCGCQKRWFLAGKTGGKVIAHICWKQFHNDACASAARVTVEYMHTN
jgi:hypothetical protein